MPGTKLLEAHFTWRSRVQLAPNFQKVTFVPYGIRDDRHAEAGRFHGTAAPAAERVLELVVHAGAEQQGEHAMLARRPMAGTEIARVIR